MGERGMNSFSLDLKSWVGRCLRTLRLMPQQRIPCVYGWEGDYRSWEEAKMCSGGYDQRHIMSQTLSAVKAVRNGLAAYERDSVVFAKPEYNWPLVACLMHVAARNKGRLSVLDFGGAFGSSYFQNKLWFDGLRELRWNIVEQPHYVEVGVKELQDAQLKFFQGIDMAAKSNPNVVLLSGVLAYLQNPYEMLKQAQALACGHIIIDRTGFTLDATDRLTIQRVPPFIYEATYPCWFLSRERFMSTMTPAYELIAEFSGADEANIPSEYKGFLFRKTRLP